MVAYTCNPRIWEPVAGGSLRVQGQLEPQSETLKNEKEIGDIVRISYTELF